MTSLPSGTVTLLFTDIGGSTALVRALGEGYGDVLASHHRIVRQAIGPGIEVSTEGDFGSASAVVATAVAIQRGLVGEPWPAGVSVRVRIGIHTGQPALGGDGYVGLDVHRAARIAAAGHGGQVLLSASTEALVRSDLPHGVAIRDLGLHQLKDLADPERIYQLVVGGLESRFPPLRSAAGLARTNLPDGLTSFVGRDREIGQLEELLSSRRLVTVVGTGGTGKTRLAIEAARRLMPRSEDGAWLVELATISDPELVAGAVARALGVRAEPGVATLDVVADFVRFKRLLLLLDNCEHLARPGGLRRGSPRSDRPHPVVLRLVGELGQAERLEQRRHVDAEPAAEALLEAVPAADRVVRRAAPGLDRALGCRLLLVGAAEWHPVAVGLEPRVEVVDGPQVVAELRAADLAHDRRWIGGLVAPHRVLGRARRRLQPPRILARALPRRHPRSLQR